MSNKNDGGPAFPHTRPGGLPGMTAKSITYFGITVRDYFAAKALAGLLSDPELDGSPHQLALAAYDFADAMLDVRAAPKA